MNISHSHYEHVHGHAPKGRGGWAFEVIRYVQYADGARTERKVQFAPMDRTYTEAKAWIRHQIAGDNSVTYVAVCS